VQESWQLFCTEQSQAVTWQRHWHWVRWAGSVRQPCRQRFKFVLHCWQVTPPGRLGRQSALAQVRPTPQGDPMWQQGWLLPPQTQLSLTQVAPWKQAPGPDPEWVGG